VRALLRYARKEMQMNTNMKDINDSQFADLVELVRSDLVERGSQAGWYPKNDAEEKVDAYLKTKLKDGKDTDNQVFRAIFDTEHDQNLGYLWLSTTDEAPKTYLLAFIYVFPELRRRGIAKTTMKWIDDYAQQHDIKEIKLNVFAANVGIREFYASVGFDDVNIAMTKTYKI
jgi:GNAT superfamily N-acetyltransferase